MEARASIRNVPIAPRKARLVADLVKDQYVEEAINQLTFTHKAASPVIRKLIQSATANARHNAQQQGATIDESNLCYQTDCRQRWPYPKMVSPTGTRYGKQGLTS